MYNIQYPGSSIQYLVKHYIIKEEQTYKIAITGPESTGKSELAMGLAAHFSCDWVPEYAREYLEKLDRQYNQNDILKIAKGQVELENSNANIPGKYLFCDTDLLVCKIWSEKKFGSCDPWILEMLESHQYDLYLLCNTDIPWEPDPLRENPLDRDKLFDIYHNELKKRNFPFQIIKGTGAQRLENAIDIVEGLRLGA